MFNWDNNKTPELAEIDDKKSEEYNEEYYEREFAWLSPEKMISKISTSDKFKDLVGWPYQAEKIKIKGYSLWMQTFWYDGEDITIKIPWVIEKLFIVASIRDRFNANVTKILEVQD